MAGRTDEEKRLAELRKKVPTRGWERHPSLLKNLSELPIELQAPGVIDLAACQPIRTIVSFPPQIQRGWDYVPNQALIFTETDVIHLLASIWPGREPQITHLQRSNLLYLNITLVLLYGFLEFVAQGPHSLTRISVEFNTVAWNYLSQPLCQFLTATASLPGRRAHKASDFQTLQQALESLPLKFSNGLKIYGLLPGEELEELVFQPSIWKRWLYFLQRPVSANTLLALTSRYMVVIQEELHVKQGWVISYIPRDNIVRMQNQPADAWNELVVHLERENQAASYKIILGNEAAQSWRRQWVEHEGDWQDIVRPQV